MIYDTVLFCPVLWPNPPVWRVLTPVDKRTAGRTNQPLLKKSNKSPPQGTKTGCPRFTSVDITKDSSLGLRL